MLYKKIWNGNCGWIFWSHTRPHNDFHPFPIFPLRTAQLRENLSELTQKALNFHFQKSSAFPNQPKRENQRRKKLFFFLNSRSFRVFHFMPSRLLLRAALCVEKKSPKVKENLNLFEILGQLFCSGLKVCEKLWKVLVWKLS